MEDYSNLFELSNLPLLETLIIGSTTETSNNFYSASFKVHGIVSFIVLFYRFTRTHFYFFRSWFFPLF